MSRNDCPSLNTLSDFVLGNLSVSELGTVAGHLDGCPECERKIGQLDGMADEFVMAMRRSPSRTRPRPRSPSHPTWPRCPQQLGLFRNKGVFRRKSL